MYCKCGNYRDEQGLDHKVLCNNWEKAFQILPVGTLCLVSPHRSRELMPYNSSDELFDYDSVSYKIEKLDDETVLFEHYKNFKTGNVCETRKVSIKKLNDYHFTKKHSWCDSIKKPSIYTANGGFPDRIKFDVKEVDDYL